MSGRNHKVIVSIVLAVTVIGAAAGAFLYRKVDAKFPWVWNLLAQQMQSSPVDSVEGTKHVMFSFVDHFEPHDQEPVSRWTETYPQVVSQYRDADGVPPQHSWFWYFSYSDDAEKFRFLNQLSGLAFQGLGEIELHMHHYGDNEESFLGLMNHAIELSQSVGAMVTAEPQPRQAFGFIHGLWALDNSREGACGVNNELELLRKLHAYADFTHPSWGKMHPKIVNQLYYATDDPAQPKSYDEGIRMKVGQPGIGDLLIFEGPSVVGFNSLKLTYDHGDITMVDLPTPKRIDGWVDAGIHVEGRPEWIFVKVYTHGALLEDHEAVLGEWRDTLHSYLNEKYNDGEEYKLHYVTAREAYNIAKAAEAGKLGDPNDYRDFLIAPYINRKFIADIPFETIEFGETQAVIRFRNVGERHAEPLQTTVQIKGTHVQVFGDAVVKSQTAVEGVTTLELSLTGQRVVGFRLGKVIS